MLRMLQTIIPFAYHAEKSLSKGKMFGIYHNLDLLYQQINILYFDNQIQAQICWGRLRYNKRRKKRSIRLGSYCFEKKQIIIHPSLDQAFIPTFCVERIVHHEMLHQKFPISQHQSGKRCIHSPAFKQAEKEFKYAQEADGWFKKNLKILI